MTISASKLVSVELPAETWVTVMQAIADEAQSVSALMQRGGARIELPVLIDLRNAVARLNAAAEAIEAAALGS